jgi:uncharacterized repeat protein (TIGR01451 family)
MGRSLPIILVLLFTCAWSAQAGVNPNAKAAIHVLPHNPDLTCSHDFPEIISCQQIVTTYGGCDDVDIFPVFFDLVEYQGVEYGIEWPGIGSCAFTSCSDLTIGGIENSGDGISHAWYVCHSGPVAIPGWGWLTADEYGPVCLVPHPLAGGVIVGDCDYGSVLDTLETTFCAGVCGMPGDEPCGAAYLPIDLTKTDGLPGQCVNPGDNIAYEIGYDNSPNFFDIHNVVLTDYLDPDTDFLSASAGGLYDPGTHTVTWSLGTLGPGESGSVDLAVEVSLGATPGSQLENRCEIVCDEADASEATEDTWVCPDEYAPLGLAKGDRLHGECVEPGATIKYWIPYDNYANESAVHNVVMTDYLPEEGEYISCTGGGLYDAGSHTVVWDLGTLAAGQASEVDLLMRVDGGAVPGTIVSNTCEIVADNTPLTEYTKHTSVCFPAYSSPGLSKVSSVGGGCALRGDTVAYTIVYDNSPNTLDIHNAMLVDELHPNTIYLSGSGGGVYDGGQHEVTWNLGTVGGGIIDSVGVTVEIDTLVGGSQVIANTCRLSCDEVPAVEDGISFSICPSELRSLTLGKTASHGGACVSRGSNTTYTLSYTNPNSEQVVEVVMVDHLPGVTSFVSATGGGAYEPGAHTVTWDIGVVPAGASGEAQLVVYVPYSAMPGSAVHNQCEIAGLETGTATAAHNSTVCGGPGNVAGKAAIHVMEHASRTCSKSFPAIASCGDIEYTVPSCDVDAFPVFFDLMEYQGFDYSLSWPGTYTCAFTSCSDLTIGSIVNPGDGVSHAWYTCQPGPIAVTGWAWIYEGGPSQICPVAHPEAGAIVIGDCSAGLSQPEVIFCAGIAGALGDDPCLTTSIRPTTWGGIKAMYK